MISNPVTVLIAPAAYKGTLSAQEAAELLAQVLKEDLGPAVRLCVCPIADGGDDTVAVLAHCLPQAQIKTVTVTGPIDNLRVQAQYLWEPATKTVIIESAQAHGLKLLGNDLQPLRATSYGVGELIGEALRVCAPSTVVVSVGGSASTDGGLGALQALGLCCVDEGGQRILTPLGGGDLPRVQRLFWAEPFGADWGALPNLIIATDVQNPLLGVQGAAAVFAPQKGADEAQCRDLAQGLAHVRALLVGQFARDYAFCPGSGAAGGLAYGLQYWPGGATVVSGSQWVAEALRLPQQVAEADVILSGEGCFDATSLGGKAVGYLLGLAGQKPVFLFPGQCQPGLKLSPTVQCLPLAPTALEVPAAMADPKQALRRALKAALPRLSTLWPAI